LDDHPAIVLSPFHVNDSSLFPRINPEDTEKLIEEYRQGKGILASLTEGPQCFKASSRAESGWPNIWTAMAASIRTSDVPQVVSFYTVLGRQRSKGSVSLNTELYKAGIRDDVQLALIDFGLLRDPADVEDLVEGNGALSKINDTTSHNYSILSLCLPFAAIKFVLQIVEETKAFQRLNMSYAATHQPACLEFEFRSDAYWKCVVVQEVVTWTHMGGTCGMGGDMSDSVVDSKLRLDLALLHFWVILIK